MVRGRRSRPDAATGGGRTSEAVGRGSRRRDALVGGISGDYAVAAESGRRRDLGEGGGRERRRRMGPNAALGGGKAERAMGRYFPRFDAFVGAISGARRLDAVTAKTGRQRDIGKAGG